MFPSWCCLHNRITSCLFIKSGNGVSRTIVSKLYFNEFLNHMPNGTANPCFERFITELGRMDL